MRSTMCTQRSFTFPVCVSDAPVVLLYVILIMPLLFLFRVCPSLPVVSLYILYLRRCLFSFSFVCLALSLRPLPIYLYFFPSRSLYFIFHCQQHFSHCSPTPIATPFRMKKMGCKNTLALFESRSIDYAIRYSTGIGRRTFVGR